MAENLTIETGISEERAYRLGEALISIFAIYHLLEGDAQFLAKFNVVARGKTKDIVKIDEDYYLISTDSLTAKDGKNPLYCLEIEDKGVWSTITTTCIYTMISDLQVDTHILDNRLTGDGILRIEYLDQIPLEVVTRLKVAEGSSTLKRKETNAQGELYQAHDQFSIPTVEFYYKVDTAGEDGVIHSDPVAVYDSESGIFNLYDAKTRLLFGSVDQGTVLPNTLASHIPEILSDLGSANVQILSGLREKFITYGVELYDGKCEYGLRNNSVILTDVFDVDSARYYISDIGCLNSLGLFIGFKNGDEIGKALLRNSSESEMSNPTHVIEIKQKMAQMYSDFAILTRLMAGEITVDQLRQSLSFQD